MLTHDSALYLIPENCANCLLYRLDAIITRYAAKIRRLSVSDDQVKAAGGVSGFAQAVLVPELTVMLVKEDMNVGDEGARQILRESMEIGDLVNDEENDVVEWNGEDEY
jgi:hypothetical protein